VIKKLKKILLIIQLINSITKNMSIEKKEQVVHLLSDYKKLPYNLRKTDLSFRILENGMVECSVKYLIEFMANCEPIDVTFDTDPNIVIRSASLPYVYGSEQIVIKHGDLKIDEHNKTTVEFAVTLDPANNTKLMGLYMSNGVYCTQCEPNGYRSIVPSIDRPDQMSLYRVRIEGDKEKYPVMLSNGNLIENGTNYVVYEDPYPKSSYLFAIVVGKLGHIENYYYLNQIKLDKNKITLRIYAPVERLKQLEWAMESLKMGMKSDEEEYGLSYDLKEYNIVALDDFNFGAMENKGLNIFNSKYLISDPDISTDDENETIQGVVVHEYYHNWRGNRVAPKNWFALTLKEGLTVYTDQEFTLKYGTMPLAKRINDCVTMRTRQFVEDHGPNSHPIRPNHYVSMDNFYTTTVYNKGAEIIRIYKQLLRKSGFRRGIDLYFKRHDMSAVDCNDFWRAMYDANISFSKSIELFENQMKRLLNWYDQPGTPHVEIEVVHKDNLVFVNLKQTNKRCEEINGSYNPVLIPIKMGLFDSKTGKELEFELNGFRGKEGTIFFCEYTDNVCITLCEPLEGEIIPSMMRDFSAPVTVEYKLPSPDQMLSDQMLKDQILTNKLFLIKNDTNDFNRWDYSQDVLKSLIVKVYNGETDDLDKYWDMFASFVMDEKMNPVLKSYVLTLPSYYEMINLIKSCDPTKLYNVYLYCYQKILSFGEIENFLINRCVQLVDENCTTKYNMDRDDVLRRKQLSVLMNILSYSSNRTSIDEVVCKLEKECNNVVDKLIAIRYFTTSENELIEEILDRYIKQNNSDSLKVCKWLGFHSMMRTKKCVETLSEIFNTNNSHNSYNNFSKKTPNHVMSLMGSFTTINPFFHLIENGRCRGYEVLTDIILDIDKINQNVSARLAKTFEIKKNLCDSNRLLMESCIERIRKTEGVSSNVLEVLG